MSKDEAGCKLASVYKHKERKPKKPHYIPRPWGKPYNYKCFQCPFTCMEKSHLYNHMKYSLCKNSLSLLIESDWPYKKGNLLHPELRLLHTTEASRARGRRDEPEAQDPAAVAANAANPEHGVDQDGGGHKPACAEDSASDRMSEETNQFQEEEEEEEEEMSGLLQEAEAGEKEKAREAGCGREPSEPEVNTLLFKFKNKRDKPGKEPAPDFIITDVFSLKNHVMKGKEPTAAPLELEAKPKHGRVPKKCPASGGILMEQWKLVANGQRRSAGEVPAQCPDGNIIPCYPPPAYGEYPEPQSLNLSLLGINYPLNPNLFSYLGPSVAGSAAPHSHLTQLPFLASTAQLMHPHSAHFQPLQSPERSAFLPRFYYPLLFEHSFGSAENKMAALKPEAQPQPGAAVPAPPQVKNPPEPTKAGLLKVPVLKTTLPWMKGFHEEASPEPSHKALLLQDEEEKWLVREKEGGALLGGGSSLRRKPAADAYRSLMGIKDDAPLLPNSARKAELPVATCLEGSGTPVNTLKRKFAGNGFDFVGSDILMPGKVAYQTSSGLRPAPAQLSKTPDHWHVALHACPPEDQPKNSGADVLSPLISPSDHFLFKHGKGQGVRDPEVTTALIGDLSKTLEEYQEVEKKLSDLAKEDTPAQKQLREQLVKIRQELFHIHRALEKASKPSEGPLDLSVKRSSKSLARGHQDKKEAKASLDSGKPPSKDPASLGRRLAAGEEDGTSSCPLEPQNKTIDLLIKMSHTEHLRTSSSEAHLGAVIKAEVLPLNVPLELRHVMEPYYSRTTKCEADSSVLLCTDGRSNPSQVPPLPMPEEAPLGGRALPRSLSCGLPSETDGVCIHSPLNTEP
ncbi:UNVERIFIED_CONTAM: hypothetical protein K2H54_014457 [Gekko kuhli]